MNLQLERLWYTKDSTGGKLYLDGVFFCYTLEDFVRPVGEKIAGKTAIPSGEYEVVVDFSNRFQKQMPHILNVPNFEGIRIHSGNTSTDTEGCILLGKTRTKDFVGNSREAFQEFMPLLENGLRKGEVSIHIIKGKL